MKFTKSIKFRMFLGLGVLAVVLCICFIKIFNYLNDIGQIIEIKHIENTQLIQDVQEIKDLTVFSLLVFMAVGIIIVTLIANSVLFPIIKLTKQMEDLSKGLLPEITEVTKFDDEIDSMRDSLKAVTEGIKNTAQFAFKIGKGELEAKFTPLSDHDMLGLALLNMRTNLIDAQKVDENRNSIVTSNAEVSNLLRSHTQLETMGDDLIKFLAKKVNAIQSAFYVVEEGKENEKIIILTHIYAYNKKKNLKKTFKFGEGLVGQSAIEMDFVHRTEIPRDYVSITSGLLGEQRPTSIFIMPLITNEKVYGVLEFASIQKFTNLEIEIIKDISEIVAQTIFNLQVTERTAKLLAESQRMSSELSEQSIALQQNAEEMQATQEELTRSNAKLEEQIVEVNNSQNRTHILLENSSEVISIISKEGTVTYVSPSVNSILGYEVEELLGTKELNRVTIESQESFIDMFKSLLTKPEKVVTLVYSYQQKNGEVIWLEVLGRNMLLDSSIKGIVLNARDITERRRAEQEARMRSQMQSLSENSPDLITRLNPQGKIYYVNPTIESLTAMKPSEFNKKTIYEVGLDETVIQSWDEIIKNVIKDNKKIQVEMPFPTQNGSLVMNVNAIPEYTESEEIESILLVSSDITERKKTEVEIQNKNKKITESINYAKRIQVAIIPEQTRILSQLNEYFMYYKPKDVVSGDFPWFLETETDIYLAAVDCTGHGVPGAMLSLIGYFLLNDIVKSQKINDPGKILDLLDQGVTQTLKQDVEGNEMKDGMDISLCKIHKTKKYLEYSGAHRPLYQLRNGEIIEFKGNKFAIGGGTFRNQTDFTNHKIEILKGDSFFFCSDGYPDQFGGADVKKIGPSRIKSIIQNNDKIENFANMQNIFSDFFDEWKGNQKQMDDLLLIGIRF